MGRVSDPSPQAADLDAESGSPEPPLHQALGLTDDEFAQIGELLGRQPNHLELAISVPRGLARSGRNWR